MTPGEIRRKTAEKMAQGQPKPANGQTPIDGTAIPPDARARLQAIRDRAARSAAQRKADQAADAGDSTEGTTP